MQELDKAAMGRRIRQIRLEAGLRQWELAKMLGTTQSAIHKYEHGVVPEPKRLVELSRIGETSVEWLLTGRHWENGSTAQERVSHDLLRTATLLADVDRKDRATAEEALRILRDAQDAIAASGGPRDERRPSDAGLADLLRSAAAIRDALVDRLASDSRERMRDSNLRREGGSGKPPASRARSRRRS